MEPSPETNLDLNGLISFIPAKYQSLAAALLPLLLIWLPRIYHALATGKGFSGAFSGAVLGTNTPGPGPAPAPSPSPAASAAATTPPAKPPPVDKLPLWFLLALFSFGAAAIITGCNANQVGKAVQADSLVITGGNAAMTAWAARVQAGQATAAQVNTVSNAYALYYNSQLILSNAAMAYVANPATNLATAAELALATATAAESNLVGIVQLLTAPSSPK